MLPVVKIRICQVNCRIGSLEMQNREQKILQKVNCRIGSLENNCRNHKQENYVNCRIGSLEIVLWKDKK